MAKSKNARVEVNGISVRITQVEGQDYICLTDIAKHTNNRSEIVIQNWLRNAGTLDFLKEWEDLYNENFNHIEFDGIRIKAGTPSFTMTPKQWLSLTDAKGIVSKAGRYGGTYAHKDIAFEFCSAISPRFKLILIKEFQRLKEEEARRLGNPWSIRREIAKANYLIHADAVKEHLVPPKLYNTRREGIVFASEADLLNMALFGQTAKEWKKAHPKGKGNLRDQASAEQLLVLANLESLNAKLIEWDCDQSQRLDILRKTAQDQLEILMNSQAAQRLRDADDRQKRLD